MPLTRDFRETIAARVQRDPRFREALFTEALNSYLAGDTVEGKAILRDLVNATIGFEGLADEVGLPSKSLHRMLSPRGNPSSENFFEIVHALQKRTRVKLLVTAGDPRFWEMIEARRRSARTVPLAEVRRRLGLPSQKKRRRAAGR